MHRADFDPKRKRMVYIAGPYRAKTWGEVRENVHQARIAGQMLLKLGYAVIIPHTMTHGMELDEGLTDDDFLRQGIECLLRCDAVMLLPNWQNSEGTQAEIAVAKSRGIPVFASRKALLAGFPAR